MLFIHKLLVKKGSFNITNRHPNLFICSVYPCGDDLRIQLAHQ